MKKVLGLLLSVALAATLVAGATAQKMDKNKKGAMAGSSMHKSMSHGKSHHKMRHHRKKRKHHRKGHHMMGHKMGGGHKMGAMPMKGKK